MSDIVPRVPAQSIQQPLSATQTSKSPGEKIVAVPKPRKHHVEHVPDTQRAAFEKTKPKLPQKRQEALDVVVAAGTKGTNLQAMEDLLHRPKNTFSGRISELLKDRLIVDTGRRVRVHGEWFRVVAAAQQTLRQFLED